MDKQTYLNLRVAYTLTQYYFRRIYNLTFCLITERFCFLYNKTYTRSFGYDNLWVNYTTDLFHINCLWFSGSYSALNNNTYDLPWNQFTYAIVYTYDSPGNQLKYFDLNIDLYTDPGNYTPVSLTCICQHEPLVFRKLTKILEIGINSF